MTKNIHRYERVARVVGGGILGYIAYKNLNRPWLLGSIVPVVTGLVGTCPAYSALGINTRDQSVEAQANAYMPVQSDSEEMAGHPIVGVS